MLAELIELAPSGIEEVEVGEGLIEYAIYGPPGELPALPDLKAAVGSALVEVTTSEIADDWSDRWRAFHRPLVLDGRLTVRPPWEPAGDTQIDLVIDPGQAFGTGGHATTRLCLELLLSIPADGSLVDLGCGSGVLAIAAARLGFAPVIGLDNDAAAVEATRANAAANDARVEVESFDLRTRPAPEATTVTANLLSALLLQWRGRGAQRVIASGILQNEADRVSTAFEGFRECARLTDGDWVALLLER